jgi:hypothetical protein
MTVADPLAGLRDIRLPETPALVPDGLLWVAAVLILLLAFAVVWRVWQRRHLHAALRALKAAEAMGGADPAGLTRAAAAVWRAYAGRRFPRANLIGADEQRWQAFLLGQGPAPDAALLTLPYQPQVTGPAAMAFVGACRRWLKANPP